MHVYLAVMIVIVSAYFCDRKGRDLENREQKQQDIKYDQYRFLDIVFFWNERNL